MYIPGGFILFDRLVAASRFTGTSVFLIYVSDVFGQFGTFGVVTCVLLRPGLGERVGVVE